MWPSLTALVRAEPELLAAGSNVVLVAGPSRTADIEMTLTHGVHGPKHVHVILMP
jgi:L-lactate dehydrogenase complex protein LldG